MVRGRPVRASTIAATKASLALSIPYGRSKSVATSKRKDYNTFAQNGAMHMNATAIDVTTMRRRRQHCTRKMLKPNATTPTPFDEQPITNYFRVKVKSDASGDNIYNTFASMHTNYSDPDGDEEVDDESDDAMQQFNGFDFQNRANISVTSTNAAQRSKLNASGSLSTDYDDDDDDDDDDDESGSNHSSTSQNSIQPTNIFLQKPVLHLDIDKSPNQPSSIVINKHLDVCPNFALSFAAFNNSIIRRSTDEANAASVTINTANTNNNNNNNCIQRQSMADERKRKSFSQQMHGKLKCTKRMSKRASGSVDSGLIDALNHSDSNSCDSGVVVDKSFEPMAANAIKPTTPHRIVCPSTSPVKHFKDPQQSTNNNNNSSPKSTSAPKARGKSSQQKLNAHESENLLKFAVFKTCETQTTSPPIIIIDDESDQSASENTNKTESNSESESDVKPIKVELPSTNLFAASAKSPTPTLKSKRLTDYFPVRRSVRKTKKAVEQEYLRHIEIAIEKQSEDGLVVKVFKDKGRGICAGRPFARGEFVVEYIGDLIEQNEADRREEIYAKNSAVGCYMYYFKHKEQQWCIDATTETGKLGRLVNHSRNGNLATKIVNYKNRPHLVLIAKENIKEGEELNYDYGDRTRESLINHPWLAL